MDFKNRLILVFSTISFIFLTIYLTIKNIIDIKFTLILILVSLFGIIIINIFFNNTNNNYTKGNNFKLAMSIYDEVNEYYKMVNYSGSKLLREIDSIKTLTEISNVDNIKYNLIAIIFKTNSSNKFFLVIYDKKNMELKYYK